MASLNRVFIIGHLGADAEIRGTANGQEVASMRVATSERWTDRSGEAQERTEWHSVSVWGRGVEIARDRAKRGAMVCVEGRIQSREWTTAQGEKRTAVEIRADRVTYLDRRQLDAAARAPERAPVPYADDDIPF